MLLTRNPLRELPTLSTSPLARAAVSLFEAMPPLGLHGLEYASALGDLDAVRMHVEVFGASASAALRMSVRHSQPHLLRHFLATPGGRETAGCGGSVVVPRAAQQQHQQQQQQLHQQHEQQLYVQYTQHGPSLLHEALGVCMGEGGCASEEANALEVVSVLCAAGADLDAAIWPNAPEIGTDEQRQYHHQHGERATPQHGGSALCLLPQLRRGDAPLAWAVQYANMTAGCSHSLFRPLVCGLIRCLVRNGASIAPLSRRQRQSLDGILREEEEGEGKQEEMEEDRCSHTCSVNVRKRKAEALLQRAEALFQRGPGL